MAGIPQSIIDIGREKKQQHSTSGAVTKVFMILPSGRQEVLKLTNQ